MAVRFQAVTWDAYDELQDRSYDELEENILEDRPDDIACVFVAQCFGRDDNWSSCTSQDSQFSTVFLHQSGG